MHYYQFNIGDYRRDTSHLSLLEHGIYRQLIDTYYLSEKPLCADYANLMRSHCVRTDEEEKALKLKQNPKKVIFKCIYFVPINFVLRMEAASPNFSLGI